MVVLRAGQPFLETGIPTAPDSHISLSRLDLLARAGFTAFLIGPSDVKRFTRHKESAIWSLS